MYDTHQNPIDLAGTEVGGTVSVQFRDQSKAAMEAQLQRITPATGHDVDVEDAGHGDEAEAPGVDQFHLSAALDLSGVAAGQARARFSLVHLPAEKEKQVTFLQKVEVASHGDEDDHGEQESDTEGHSDGHGEGGHH